MTILYLSLKSQTRTGWCTKSAGRSRFLLSLRRETSFVLLRSICWKGWAVSSVEYTRWRPDRLSHDSTHSPERAAGLLLHKKFFAKTTKKWPCERQYCVNPGCLSRPPDPGSEFFQCCGSGMFIPDTRSLIRIFTSRIKKAPEMKETTRKKYMCGTCKAQFEIDPAYSRAGQHAEAGQPVMGLC
jgi:hypothetical protein